MEDANGTLLAAYTYDDNGNLLTENKGGTVTTQYTYNMGGLLTGKTNKKTSDNSVISDYDYIYYLDGNIKSENTRTFTYDNLGRLKQEQNGTDTISYTYDKFGNRATMTNNGTVTSYTYDLNNRLLQEVSGDEYTFYNYDNKGNLYSKRTDERSTAGNLTRVDTFGALKDNVNSTVELYSYDGFNRLQEVRKGGTTVSYVYNAEGIRTSKTVNGTMTEFLLDGANVVAETKNGSTTNYIRGLTGIISSSIQGTNNTTKYYTSDGHGNITKLTDSSGSVVKTYAYDAFGVEQNIDSNDTNPFRYCGEYCDSEIGQIYLRARYYNPALGRFTQQDPARDGENWYVYCKNNPVFYIDLDGLVAYELFESLEKAAEDWAWNTYSQTEYIMLESGSIMYSIVIDGKTYYSYTNGVVGEAHGVDLLQILHTDDIFKNENVTAVATIHNHVLKQDFSEPDTELVKNKYRGYMPNLYAGFMVSFGDKAGTANIYKYSETRQGYQKQDVFIGLTYNHLSKQRKEDLSSNTIIKSRWENHLNNCTEWKCHNSKWPEED